ncbi:MAG: hypothetical protein HZA54_04150 [Planctomycetes bacterium]|nr:hypothetical protein [Planctomycetota bacterium]
MLRALGNCFPALSSRRTVAAWVLLGALALGARVARADLYVDDLSGITLHAPGWRLAGHAATPETPERLRLELGGPEAPEAYVALTLGRAAGTERPTLAAFREELLAGLPKDWRRLPVADLPVGTARVPGLRARLALREGEIDWTTDLFFFRSENAYFWIQTMAASASLGQMEPRYLAVVTGAELAWAAAPEAAPGAGPEAAAGDDGPVGTWALFTPGAWGAWRGGARATAGDAGAPPRRDPRWAADAGFVQIAAGGRWIAHGCGKFSGRWEEDEGTPVLRDWAGEDYWLFPDRDALGYWLCRTARGVWLHAARIADARLVEQAETTPSATCAGSWRLVRADSAPAGEPGPEATGDAAAAGTLVIEAAGAWRLTLGAISGAGTWKPSGDRRIDGLALAGTAGAGAVTVRAEAVVTLDSRDNRRIVVRIGDVEYRGTRANTR